jgi:uncharacterized protein YqgC (DUF456 family)
MTFEAGARLIWDLFFGIFVNVMMTWIVKVPFIRDAVGEFIEGMNNYTAAAGNGTSDSQFARFPRQL